MTGKNGKKGQGGLWHQQESGTPMKLTNSEKQWKKEERLNVENRRRW